MIKMAHNLPRMGDPSVGEGSEQTAASSRCGSSASESYAIGGTQEQMRARTLTNAPPIRRHTAGTLLQPRFP